MGNPPRRGASSMMYAVENNRPHADHQTAALPVNRGKLPSMVCMRASAAKPVLIASAVAPLISEPQRELPQAAVYRVRRPFDLARITQSQVRRALDQHGQGDLAHEPRERGSERVIHALPE